MAQERIVMPPSRARAAIASARALLTQLEKAELCPRLDRLEKDLNRERFTVAVVGEFSRGKSTLINRLLGRELLPVGNMPTTAMLTCIRGGSREGMVYVDDKGKRTQPRAIRQENWEGLVANNFGGPDPQGTVFLSVNHPFLSQYALEILDTPGAGDLEERRAQKIGDALLGADGAIIAISALSPMSMSEQQFIQQRLIARKTPFMLLAITKLDEVPESQRGAMIAFIRNKLKLWNMDIPVFVAGDVKVPEAEYASIIGVDKIRAQLRGWVADPRRRALTDQWVLAKVADVLSVAQESVQEQLRLVGMDEAKRAEAIGQKKEQLNKIQESFQQICAEMRARAEACVQKTMTKAEDQQKNTIQRLRYEVSHNSQPASWWKQDFGYRLRVELAGMASGLDSFAGRIIGEDVRWLNARLDKGFKTTVAAQYESITDKEAFADAQAEEMELENLDKQRTISRIATTALTIVGSLTLSTLGLGMFNIVCTSGIGTGSALLTEKFFKAKVEKQREVVAQAIAIQVPRTVAEALEQTKSRLTQVYEDVIASAQEKVASWTQAQESAIQEAGKSQQQEDKQQSLTLALEQLKGLMQAMGNA